MFRPRYWNICPRLYPSSREPPQANRSFPLRHRGSIVPSPARHTAPAVTVKEQPMASLGRRYPRARAKSTPKLAHTRPVVIRDVRSSCRSVIVVTRPKAGTSQRVYAVSQRMYATANHTSFPVGVHPLGMANKSIVANGINSRDTLNQGKNRPPFRNRTRSTTPPNMQSFTAPRLLPPAGSPPWHPLLTHIKEDMWPRNIYTSI